MPHNNKKYFFAHYRPNQYFRSPALIVHAGLGEGNEAKLQRQCAHKSRLSTKWQNDLSDLLDQSHFARVEMLLKRITRDLESCRDLHDSLWVGIYVWASTHVVPSDLVCQSPHTSYGVCCQHTLNYTLYGKTWYAIKHMLEGLTLNWVLGVFLFVFL